MDQETKTILENLDHAEKHEKDLTADLVSIKQERSNMLRDLVGKIGVKTYTRNGKAFCICKRGETYFTKELGGGKIVSLD